MSNFAKLSPEQQEALRALNRKRVVLLEELERLDERAMWSRHDPQVLMDLQPEEDRITADYRKLLAEMRRAGLRRGFKEGLSLARRGAAARIATWRFKIACWRLRFRRWLRGKVGNQ